MPEAQKKCLLPKEYLTTINNTHTGWHTFTMTNMTIELNEQDKIDEVSALPTPWARMEFVNMVFSKWAGNTANEALLTLEEKHIINHTFDLLELIFYSNFYAVDLEFQSIADFREGNYFGKATDTFFQFPKPVLIKARRSGTPVLLGSTSPYTLVYPAMHLIQESYPLGKGWNLFNRDTTDITPLNRRPKMFASFLAFIANKLSDDKTHSTQVLKTALNAWVGKTEKLNSHQAEEAVQVAFSS